MIDGSADVVEYQLNQLLGERTNHFRFNVGLDAADDEMDDASKSNIRRLEERGEQLVKK